MTRIFLEHLPWLPVIQPYEDYGLQKYVEWTPNPNQQFEIRKLQVPPRVVNEPRVIEQRCRCDVTRPMTATQFCDDH
jgi:hypothetical protein